MLERLSVNNFALMQAVTLDFNAGFSVITGETGSGKSLLIGSIEAIMGGRINKTLIRTGTDRARIEAVFSVSPGVFTDEEKETFEIEDHIIFSREILSSGKQYLRANGRTINLNMFKDLATRLVDIHGQRDGQLIFDASQHRFLLDRLDSNIQVAIQEYKIVYDRYLKLQKQMKHLAIDEMERLRQVDILSYQVNEIESANLEKGQIELLRKDIKKMNYLKHILEELQTAAQALDSEQIGYTNLLIAISALERSAKVLPKLEHLIQPLKESVETINMTFSKLSKIVEDINFSPEALEEAGSRLDVLGRLQKKYGGDEDHILDYLSRVKIKLEQLNSIHETIQKYDVEKQQLEKDLLEKGQIIHDLRDVVSKNLSAAIDQELKDLNMKQAHFDVSLQFNGLDHFDAHGMDKIEFLLEANVGEGLKPLSQTASGGEASRIMLAIKSVLAKVDQRSLLIFDEIDTGVSGESAARVGEKLLTLSRYAQVICVTHSAHIAALADHQYLVRKQVLDNRSETQFESLNPQESLEEIARLLSGETDRKTSLQLAKSLVERANVFKESL